MQTRDWLKRAESDLSQVNDADTLARRGRVRAELGDREGSERDFEDAVARGGLGAWLWTWWGIAHRRSGELSSAREKLSRAIRESAEHAEAWAQRGHVRFDAGDHAGAADDYEQAIRHNPGLAPLLAERLQEARTQQR